VNTVANRSIFRLGESETNRVEAFSDGVLAIVITLLVLEIKVPHLSIDDDATQWAALTDLVPTIVAWVISFVFVLVFWVAHHYLFNSLQKVDRGLLWLNGLFLLFMSFVPFPTALAGEYPATSPPLVLLSGTMLGAAASFSAMRLYVLRGHGLIAANAESAARLALRRSLIAPTLYAIGLVVAFFEPWLSIAIQVLVPGIFFLPAKATGETHRSRAPSARD
jgi:uncharacterized membrane protein